MAANPNLRMGIEAEMHGFKMTFIRTDVDNLTFWERAAAPAMIGSNPVFLPKDVTNFWAPVPPPSQGPVAVVPPKVNWESEWGFRVVTDSPGQISVVKVANTPAEMVFCCVLELQTAAAAVDNAGYWIFSRRCMQAYRDTVNLFGSKTFPAFTDPKLPQGNTVQLYPLSDFMDRYNAAVEGLQAPPGIVKNRFKLMLSAQMKQLSTGIQGVVGRWRPVFVVEDTRFCDIQLTYQIPVGNLFDPLSADVWRNTWGSMWAYQYAVRFDDDRPTQYLPFDPPNGTERWKQLLADDTSVYTLQNCKAIWKEARQAADDAMQLQFGLSVVIPDAQRNAVGALITYLFATGVVNYVEQAGVTNKNLFPQLPKTSPASIARKIVELDNSLRPIFQSFAAPNTVDIAYNLLGNALARLGDTTMLPRNGPCPGAVPYVSEDRQTHLQSPNVPSIYRRPFPSLPDTFRPLWIGAFDLAGTEAAYGVDANNQGYTAAIPFRVPWAAEAKSSVPATIYGVGAARQMKMALESRYSLSKLNIGFNAYSSETMFLQSYLSIVRCLVPASLPAVSAALTAQYAGEPDRVQEIAALSVAGPAAPPRGPAPPAPQVITQVFLAGPDGQPLLH